MNKLQLLQVTEIKTGDIVNISDVIFTVTEASPHGKTETSLKGESKRSVLHFIFDNRNWFDVVRPS